MGKAHNYVAGAILATSIATGAYILSRENNSAPYTPQLVKQTIDDKVNSNPVSADYQKPVIQNPNSNERTPTHNVTLEGLLKIGGSEMENRLYSALIAEFHENLDGLNFYGSEEFFKGDFVLEFRDTKSEDLLHAYEEKLKTLTDGEKRELETKYGEVINTLRQNSNLSIEEIASKNSYLGANETADRLWPEIKQSWEISNLGRIFADITDNDQLSSEKLDLSLRVTRAYCDFKGVEDKGVALAENIRKYQSLMSEFNVLDKKRNNGAELNQEETKKMEDYVKILGDIEEQFKKVTSADEAKARMEREIIERLNKLNPLYGFARNLTKL